MKKIKSPEAFTLRRLVLYFLKLGAVGFGGPIALIGYMQRDLVEEKKYLTKSQFLRGLALSQLSPGPLASQLAIYIGYIKNKIWGATLTGIALVLPSFIMVVILGFFYKTYGNLAWIQALFYGVSAAVLAIVTKSAYKLTTATCERKKLLWIIFLSVFGISIFKPLTVFWLLLLGGLIAILIYEPPKFLSRLPLLGAFGAWPFVQNSQSNKSLGTIFFFFLKASVFVFGSGLAIIPFLHGGVVEQFHWLSEKQFLDAVSVSMITPGPVVITVAFIGFLVNGFWGALTAALGIFLPVWLIIVIATPYYERIAHNLKIKAFVSGITAAACGAIAAAVLLISKTSIKDIPTVLIALASLILLFRFKIPEVALILVAATVGLILQLHLF